ncbi:hypothetical protein AWZ03_001525 [Drosophila navojoa]|uniref:MBD domain-containing protein n=1 Tax=Drosophila navojoa TaxID=7232 RepID=A0A484BUB2_DRONA|nr:uncharacterized protein LOC108660281 [Drosophila navojoa]TDG52244.1 hypothetical protein AWZ03_001525 [Drosophila navojoa]
MGRRCCVADCPSTSRLFEHHGVTYHSFPMDAVIRAIWIKNSRISLDRQITKSVLVCSRHFRRLDFNTIKNGKYLLKPRVFPTVFPWGKMEPAEIEADHRALQQATLDGSGVSSSANSASNEDVIKATVDKIVAQILSESAERDAADRKAKAEAAAKAEAETEAKQKEAAATKEAAVDSALVASSAEGTTATSSNETTAAVTDSATEAVPAASNTGSPLSNSPPKYGLPTNIAIGARLEALSADGAWLPARIVEVNESEQTLLIRFERNNKLKVSPSTSGGNQEWIGFKSDRLRQRISSRVLPIFELEEKCMARWSGPRKFPGTIKKLLGNDTYEVLFDDGYTKNVRAVHMNKLPRQVLANIEQDADTQSTDSAPAAVAVKRPSTGATSTGKKAKVTPPRKDWPLLDMSNLDLAALGLPEIPHDGEWTCHWVNDQPIGTEGYLIVGEHQKPTVIVHDWRLPPGWIKHMYQRSNVLGKWDVILVSPSGKRFRSKSDLKVFLESQGLVYNPDVYDFSIHRRRAKDINAYVYTHDYSPQQPAKPKPMDMSVDTTATESQDQSTSKLLTATPTSTPMSPMATRRGAGVDNQYMETPVASLMPPAELMSPSPRAPDNEAMPHTTESADATSVLALDEGTVLEDGYVYIGGLKVQITDNLFVCPSEGCGKTCRKEHILQIHIRHYHKELAQHFSHCPKMQELAVKRTHPSSIEQNEQTPKNQIPNQQFFNKLHQQDLQQSRSFRRQTAVTDTSPTVRDNSPTVSPSSRLLSPKVETPTTSKVSPQATSATPEAATSTAAPAPVVAPPPVEVSPIPAAQEPNKSSTPVVVNRATKRVRATSNKRSSGSRKSSRQRTQRRYANVSNEDLPASTNAHNSPASGADCEDTRQSISTPTPTPDVRNDAKKRRVALSGTPASSPIIDSASTPSSNDVVDINAALAPPPPQQASQTPQYIKENGELIRIVRMRQEEIINCICEYGEEDGLMIQCELCLCWQHGACNGIVKESDVPDKYVCYICRNPPRVRDSMRFKHDQDWLFEGKLPVAGYHTPNPQAPKKFELLKRSHTLTGNLLDAKRSMHSLSVKINIARNRYHPKLYLWAKKWDEDQAENATTPVKRPKAEQSDWPHVPQPEAAIDPEECQYRLIEHVKIQQSLLMNRLNEIEGEIDELEKEDTMTDLKDANMSTTKEAMATFIKELETLKRLANLNKVANMKQALKNQEQSTEVTQV